MRKSAYLLLVPCVSAFVSCADNAEGTDSAVLLPENENVVRIVATVNAPLSDDEGVTRTAYNSGNNKFVWVVSDTIGIFPTTGDQVSFPIEEEQANQATVDFNGGGWDLKADAAYYAYFPFDRKNYWGYGAKNAVKISFWGQTQKGSGNADFALTYPLVSYGVNKNGNVHFSFNHLAAFGAFTVTVPAAATFTKAVLTTEDGGDYFIQEGTYDLAETTATVVPTIKAKSYGAKIEMSLENVSTTSENGSFVIFMTIPPTAVLPSEVKLSLIDNKGHGYYGYPDRTIAQFRSGYRYQRSFTMTKQGDFNINEENDDFSSEENNDVNMKQ